MAKRTGGTQFTTSSRAIVLPSPDELPEEFCTMTTYMIGRTKVDGVMNALRVLLEIGGATVEGHNHRQFKVTFEGKTCYLPSQFNGEQTKKLIRERLSELNMSEALDALDTEASDAVVQSMKKAGFKEVTPDPGTLFGIQLSTGSGYFLDQLALSMAADIELMVEARAAEISDAGNWQQIAEETERRMQEVKRERDESIREMAKQRDEALEAARTARTELEGVRKSLAGLAPLFQKET